MFEGDKAMRKFIIPIQFIVAMLSLAFSGYAEEPKEERIKNRREIFRWNSASRVFDLDLDFAIDNRGNNIHLTLGGEFDGI